MTRFIDLSIPITNDVVSDPPVMRPQIHYMIHENTWEQIAMFFPGLVKDDLPDGQGTLSAPDGSVFEGAFSRGRRNGRGSITFADGRTVDGTFVNDRLVR